MPHDALAILIAGPLLTGCGRLSPGSVRGAGEPGTFREESHGARQMPSVRGAPRPVGPCGRTGTWP